VKILLFESGMVFSPLSIVLCLGGVLIHPALGIFGSLFNSFLKHFLYFWVPDPILRMFKYFEFLT
jgi:hypothetical protein